MLKIVKDFIKTKPMLYDFFNARRPLNDELEIWIDEFSKSRNRTINFIQVGASDGLRWDPLRRFIIRDNWNGVLIEPLRPVYNMLLSNYSYVNNGRLIFENCAISEKEESIGFWSYSENFLDSLPIEERLNYLRKSSLDKRHVEKSLLGIENNEEYIKCYDTPSKPLAQISSNYFQNKKIDLIFIDAEGYDDYVIRTIDFENYKPDSIVYESHNLGERNEEIAQFLSALGYSLKNIGGDSVATLNINN